MTQHADRKTRIRDYQAAHPGVTFTAAARRIEAADIAARLDALPTGPVNTLASLLAALVHNGEALAVAARLAACLTPDPEAERLARATEAAYQARMTPPAGLSVRRRRVLEQAFQTAQDDEDRYRMYTDPDYTDPYSAEQRTLHAVATALRCAAASGDGRFAGAAADVLDSLVLDFTADAIRGYRDRLGTIPATAAEGPAARGAQAALRALAAAADISVNGDQEWTACIQLFEDARDLARAASRT
jgi:hypothetical protein